MKLGKALATGVAEERPQVHDGELEVELEVELGAEITGIAEIKDVETSAPGEVPAAR
ncbi:hypothetical protein [Streptomyces regalis]|nr:hypothetical protein [Streptomyces regalis]